MSTIQIPIINGVTLIDRADEALVSGFRWRLLSNGYVMAQRGNLYIYMHRLIAGAGPDEVVDHINHDPLDNRLRNLRLCQQAQNCANRNADRRKAGTTSRHKGVSWDRSRARWAASIHIEGKTRHLGRFSTEDDAARAYNDAAVATWGEFARLNDVEGVSPDARLISQ